MEFEQFFQPGLVGKLTRRVSKAMSVNRMKRPGAEVLSSPAMIQMMEQTCVHASEKHLPPGFTTVGYHVDVRHLASTPLGKRVTARAQLVQVDGNKLTFQVEAFDEDHRKIGEGFHRRAIIPIRAPQA